MQTNKLDHKSLFILKVTHWKNIVKKWHKKKAGQVLSNINKSPSKLNKNTLKKVLCPASVMQSSSKESSTLVADGV